MYKTKNKETAMKTEKRLKSGFSLIELLVVIAIVMLLTALLMPVILKARESAHMYTCIANLQTMGHAYKAYALDYQDCIVPIIRGSSTWKGIDWYNVLRPYGKDQVAYESFGSKQNYWIQCPKFKPTYNAYAQSGHVGFKDFLGAYRDFPSRFSQISNASMMVLMGEDHTLSIGQTELTTGLGNYYGQAHYRFAPTPHFGRYLPGDKWVAGRANVLFCDGHVENIHCNNNPLTSKNFTVN
jgi:prepilin-type processing-associated H-X9-DG protein/prepilin-type N-terminal cleavage/methylation domain-containing protein